MTRTLNPFTFSAVPLVLLFNRKEISKATGFVVKSGSQHFLVSNVHVFSGLHALSRKPLDPRWLVPEEVMVTLPTAAGGFIRQTYPLRFHGDIEKEPRDLWLEHPVFSWQVDVGALPIELPERAVHHALFESDLGLPGAASREVPYKVGLTPTLELNVVGYPFGKRGGYELFGIWTRAMIASEPAVPYEGRPAFLVDARTRSGNSGSPVIFYRTLGSFVDSQGDVHAPLGAYAEFVGIYSHRIDERADIGVVFTAAALRDVILQEHSS